MKHKEKNRKSDQKKITRDKKLIVGIALYVLVLLICIVPAVFLNSLYGYLPSFTLLMSGILSVCYLFMLRTNIDYTEISNLSNCRRGTKIDFIVKMKNRSFLVYPKIEACFYISDLFGGDDSVTTSIFTLSSHEERHFDFDVKFAHVGTYYAGLRKLKLYGLFGILSVTIPNKTRYTVQVTPNIYDFSKLNVSEKVINESQKSMINTSMEGMDYTGVREYVFGDPIKNIHWKLSAHNHNYLTKQLESYGNSGISIVMDFFSPAYDTETLMGIFDGVIETSLSVGNYAYVNGMDYTLIYYSKNGEESRYKPKDFSHFLDLIDDLPKITCERGNTDAVQLLREENNSLYGMSNIAFCTATLSRDAVQALIELKNNKKNPILFYIVPENVYDEQRKELLAPVKILDGYNISYYVISSAEEIGKAGAY